MGFHVYHVDRSGVYRLSRHLRVRGTRSDGFMDARIFPRYFPVVHDDFVAPIAQACSPTREHTCWFMVALHHEHKDRPSVDERNGPRGAYVSVNSAGCQTLVRRRRDMGNIPKFAGVLDPCRGHNSGRTRPTSRTSGQASGFVNCPESESIT